MGAMSLSPSPITNRPRRLKMLLLGGGCNLVLWVPCRLSGVPRVESSPSVCSSVTSDSSTSELPNFFIIPRMDDMVHGQSARNPGTLTPSLALGFSPNNRRKQAAVPTSQETPLTTQASPHQEALSYPSNALSCWTRHHFVRWVAHFCPVLRNYVTPKALNTSRRQ